MFWGAANNHDDRSLQPCKNLVEGADGGGWNNAIA